MEEAEAGVAAEVLIAGQNPQTLLQVLSDPDTLYHLPRHPRVTHIIVQGQTHSLYGVEIVTEWQRSITISLGEPLEVWRWSLLQLHDGVVLASDEVDGILELLGRGTVQALN